MSAIFKIHRVPRLLIAVCLALTISAPLAMAYVAMGKSGAQTEQTGSQVDRSNKRDRLHASPQQGPAERDGVKQIEAPKRSAAPRVVA
jgi:hypothetical protein